MTVPVSDLPFHTSVPSSVKQITTVPKQPLGSVCAVTGRRHMIQQRLEGMQSQTIMARFLCTYCMCCLCVHMCTWRLEVSMESLPQLLSPYCAWSLHMQVDQLASKPQRSSLCPPRHRVPGIHHHAWRLTFFYGAKLSSLSMRAHYPLNHPTLLICITLKEIAIYSYLAFKLNIELKALLS